MSLQAELEPPEEGAESRAGAPTEPGADRIERLLADLAESLEATP